MTLTVPDASVAAGERALEELAKGKPRAPIIKKLVEDVHYNTLRLNASRILWPSDIAELMGVSESTVLKRIEQGGVQAIKGSGGRAVYVIEQVPQIMRAHLAKGDTVEYIRARLRQAAERCLSANRAKDENKYQVTLVNKPKIRRKNVFRTIEIDESSDILLARSARRHGFRSADHLLRQLIEAWLVAEHGKTGRNKK